MPRPRLADAAKIVGDAAIYRLKKREAGNLVTSMTLAVAIGLGPGDVAHRLVFGLLLNLFVYLVNDCFDVDLDTQAEGRDVARTRFLADHQAAGWLGVVLLGLVCAAVAIAHGKQLLVVFAINVVVIVAYSRWLKRLPILDLVAMAAWGVSMALVGCPLDHRVGLALTGLLGLLCVVTEGVQVIRDEPTDRAAHVRTTAVVLGVPRTALVTRVMVVASALYATLWLDKWLGPLLLLGVLPTLTTPTASRSWDRLRALFGLTWLAILGRLWLSGHLSPAL
jgi:4-hydroxybenzoate polyprenyltransferase